jgi:hypothetical protein
MSSDDFSERAKVIVPSMFSVRRSTFDVSVSLLHSAFSLPKISRSTPLSADAIKQ